MPQGGVELLLKSCTEQVPQTLAPHDARRGKVPELPTTGNLVSPPRFIMSLPRAMATLTRNRSARK